MGQPTQFRLTRHLIKGFFRQNSGPLATREGRHIFDDLMDCWSSNGLNAIQCDEKLQRLDSFLESSHADRSKINGQRLHEFVIGNLNGIVFPKQTKGKNRDLYTGHRKRVQSIFDGVRMEHDPKRKQF